METITISKSEYRKLVAKSKAYEKLAKTIFEDAINESVNDIVSDFKKTNLYSEEFLSDLKEGLNQSSLYSKKK